MSNRVEDLENQVAELRATIDGLTEELVETKERVRELEAQTEEFEELVASAASAEQAPPQAPQAPTTAEQQAEARGTDERRDAQIVENQKPVNEETQAAEAAEEPADADAEAADDDDDDDEIIVA